MKITVSFIVNENLDKIVLKWLLPVETADGEVGIYGAVCKIAIFLSIFITAFRLGAEPFFFSYAKNENAKKTYATILHYFVICGYATKRFYCSTCAVFFKLKKLDCLRAYV